MKRALVLGGSMGGLLAARALVDRFDEVVLVERDRFTAIGEQRKGVPQGRHVHGLLMAGGQVIEELFPGITDELIADGALRVDQGQDFRWVHEGHPHVRFQSGLIGLTMTRPHIEGHVRRRLLARPEIRALDGHDVDELVWKDGRVVGAGVTRREDGVKDTLEADLVVDATGRASRTPRWLAANGYASPDEDAVRVGITYVTRYFKRGPGNTDGGSVVTPRPPGTRFGVVLGVEGGRYMVTLGAYLDEPLPTDVRGYLEFARGLAAPHVHDLIAGLEPIGDADTYRFPASHRRRYETLTRFPEGLVLVGDAICSFNPVFGQGMSVAALEAKLLGEHVAAGVDGLALRFFRAAAKIVDTPWDIAVGSDLRYPSVNGKRTLLVRFLHWYLSRLHVVARTDSDVSLAFQRVGNLLAAPPTLLSPRILWKILFGYKAPPADAALPEKSSLDRVA